MFLILWLISAAFSLFLISPRMFRPIIGWEVCTWEMARGIAQSGMASVKFFYLPPLYASFIALSFKLFGISEISARIPGVLCFVAVLLVICLLIKEIAGDKEEFFPACLIALVLFVFSPAALQGALVIDHPDTTLFTLLAGLFYLFLFKTERLRTRWRVLWLGILYCLCLWAKMTTALAFLIALPLAFFLSGEGRKALRLSLGVFSTGAGIFLLSWFFLAGGERFGEPFAYYTMNAADSFLVGFSDKIARVLLDVFRVNLWFSPFLLLLAIAAVLDILKNIRRQENKRAIHLGVFGLVVIMGYLAANATFSSFPKYVVPALPVLSCVIACYAWRSLRGMINQKSAALLLLFIAAGVFYYFFLVGDLVYEIFLLRQARLQEAVLPYIYRLSLKAGLYLGFPLAAVLLSRRFIVIPLGKRIVLGMFIALAGANIAVTFSQIKAGYSLNYGYGAAGIEGLKKFLEEKSPLEVFTTTEGVIVNMPGVKFSGPAVGAWETPAAFIEFMAEIKPRAFLYGLPVNNIKQLKNVLFNPEVRDFLDKNYEEYVFGSYILLLRNVRDGQDHF